MIDDPVGGIEYEECGSGPNFVFVPGSCSTGAAWRPVISSWDGQFHCVTTSLLGYGKTAERRTASDYSIAREAEIVEAVVRRTARPIISLVIHLVGWLQWRSLFADKFRSKVSSSSKRRRLNCSANAAMVQIIAALEK